MFWYFVHSESVASIGQGIPLFLYDPYCAAKEAVLCWKKVGELALRPSGNSLGQGDSFLGAGGEYVCFICLSFQIYRLGPCVRYDKH